MLSENFATALREIRFQIEALTKQNEELQREVETLSKKVESSDERIFRRQSKRIRQAVLADDYDTVDAMRPQATSLADQELIRLADQRNQSFDASNVVIDAELVNNFVNAYKTGAYQPAVTVVQDPSALYSMKEQSVANALNQLVSNNKQMKLNAEIAKATEIQRAKAERKEYMRNNNALSQRSPAWATDVDSDF